MICPCNGDALMSEMIKEPREWRVMSQKKKPGGKRTIRVEYNPRRTRVEGGQRTYRTDRPRSELAPAPSPTGILNHWKTSYATALKKRCIRALSFRSAPRCATASNDHIGCPSSNAETTAGRQSTNTSATPSSLLDSIYGPGTVIDISFDIGGDWGGLVEQAPAEVGPEGAQEGVDGVEACQTQAQEEPGTAQGPDQQGNNPDEQSGGKQEPEVVEPDPESEHVKQLRTLLEAGTEPGWTVQLSTWQSRECVEVIKKDPTTGEESLSFRYVRWSFEGYDAIARTLTAYLRREPDSLRKLEDTNSTFQEKLQILLDSHGLDWRVEGREATVTTMACIEITASGIPRGTRTRIGRFATGWYATAESIARGVFHDWAKRPGAIWILLCGRREWEEETRRINVQNVPSGESEKGEDGERDILAPRDVRTDG